MNKLSGIYAIRNTKNGKTYIGQSVDIRKRWIYHRWELEKGIHKNKHLQNAWDKDSAHFRFEVVEPCREDDLDAAEMRWIESLRSNQEAYGYNLTEGGNGIRGLVRTEAHKKAISRSKLGKPRPDMLGKPLSESTKAKIAKRLKGNKNAGTGADNHAARAVVCVETGEVFETASEAGTKYGSKSAYPCGNIIACCRGRREKAFGHTWRYA